MSRDSMERFCLETYPQRKLQRARVGGAGHLSDVGRRCGGKAGGLHVEIRQVIGEVVEFSAEVCLYPLIDGKRLLHGGIPVVRPRSPDRIRSEISKRTRLRDGERFWIEPLCSGNA